MSGSEKLLLSVFHDYVLHLAPLPNYLASVVQTQQYFQHASFHSLLYCYQSLFFLSSVSLVYNITGKTVLLRSVTCKALHSFTFSMSFIIVNDLHPGHILSEISISIFLYSYLKKWWIARFINITAPAKLATYYSINLLYYFVCNRIIRESGHIRIRLSMIRFHWF